jgi:aminoglycoside/choline kinase family phosphotransferase/GTP:adenosylcobinamide-phosphate guanylyltransferase
MTRSAQPWKALILAAGYGTRLLPHTRYLPKALFTINNVPVLDIIIEQLAVAGCGGVTVNTHHLAEKIERHCANRCYAIPVRLAYEPEILGTGGAMKNNAGFFGERPFLVINSDIITDIDLKSIYHFHLRHEHDVTMVMHDCHRFNTVAVDGSNRVTRFYRTGDKKPPDERLLAFTGIHVIHPRVLDRIPQAGTFVDIIDVYADLLAGGDTIAACLVKGHQWQDTGTPETYREIAFEKMSLLALQTAFGNTTVTGVDPIASDGSDTRWFRVHSPAGTLVACDRGICASDAVREADAFTRINRHLHDKGVDVPRLYLSDPLAGLAFMEDLGDTSLQNVVRSAPDTDTVIRLYRVVIDRLLKLAVNGAEGFDDAWTYQTPAYDRQVIIDRECRYFENEFLAGYLGLETGPLNLEAEFSRLADLALEYAVPGLMHRDMQSRNIMILNSQPFFIDVQGARRGPVQYDLAALLIDPYVDLPPAIQQQLLRYYEAGLSARRQVSPEIFRKGYACCAVTRNLQALGAFGFLTLKKHKTQFLPHIPAAVDALIRNIDHLEAITHIQFPKLAAAAEQAYKVLGF